jgi:ribonuclease J
VRVIADGAMLRLAPGRPEVVDNVEAGRLYKDGMLIGELDAMGIAERRRLAFSGHVGVALVLSARGELDSDPEIVVSGLPIRDGAGRPFEEAIHGTILGTLESLPRARRRDPEVVREAVRRAVRAAVAELWGKKPVCSVFVAVL